jgi:hypothetical protein
LTRNIKAKSGKWFKKASHVSSPALSVIINIRAEVKAK